MRRRAFALPLALALLAGSAACGRSDEPDPVQGVETRQAAGVARADPTDDAPVRETAAGVQRFGTRMVAEMVGRGAQSHPKGPPENLIVSPLSVAYAFGMLRAGARGETAREIDDVFGFVDGGPHEAFNALTRRIATTGEPPPRAEETRGRDDEQPEPTVAIANGLFVDDEFAPSEDFLRVLARQYGAGVESLDLHDPAAVDRINRWVSERTADRIPSLFDQLSDDPALVLANATYLKAEWSSTFSESDTEQAAFHVPGGDKKVPMMQQDATFGYLDGDGYQAVELPYAGGDLAMRILMPDAPEAGEKRAASPTSLLRPSVLAEVDAGLESRQVDLSMPRFEFSSNARLTSLLQSMGMQNTMDPNRVDLSGITQKKKLYLAQAVHRANITVDEHGTEAAAVTGVESGVVSAPPQASVQMRVDRPFAFTIVHEPSGTPLFLGQVADPSAG